MVQQPDNRRHRTRRYNHGSSHWAGEPHGEPHGNPHGGNENGNPCCCSSEIGGKVCKSISTGFENINVKFSLFQKPGNRRRGLTYHCHQWAGGLGGPIGNPCCCPSEIGGKVCKSIVTGFESIIAKLNQGTLKLTLI